MKVDEVDADSLSLVFSLTSKLGQTVLGSLPLSSVPQGQAERVRATVEAFRAEFVEHTLSRLLKSFGKHDQDEQELRSSKRKSPSGESSCSWGTSVVIVSFLRLWFALGMSKSLSLPPVIAPKLSKRLLSFVAQNGDGLLPELTLEIVSIFLQLPPLPRTENIFVVPCPA